VIQPWKKLSSAVSGDYRIFKVRTDRLVSPRTGKEHDAFVIDCANWVNVIALTPARELITVQQYRFGSQTVELEIPGGMIDPHDATPVEAGVRELREETGYAGRDARIIGQVFPNPAIMSNTCYTVLVEDCEPRHSLQWDQGEDLVTVLTPLAEIHELVSQGRIKHSLVVAALLHFQLMAP
jgi:8-oxo-dGTP pyrophosphatase MutT (NUDIX family)